MYHSRVRLTVISLFLCILISEKSAHASVVSDAKNSAENAGIAAQNFINYERGEVNDFGERKAKFTLSVPILMYHEVRPVRPSDSWNKRRFLVTPERFDAQMKFLSDNGYETVSLADVAGHLASSTPFTKKVFVVTFDDGFQGQYDHAFAILKKYHQKGTFFVITNTLDKARDYATWDEVKALDEAGMEIGGHTKSHPDLTSLGNVKLHDEIAGSKELIESHLGHKINVFAYPYGYYNSRVLAEAQKDGFIAVASVLSGEKNSAADMFTLKRYNMNSGGEIFSRIFAGAIGL